MKPKTPSNRTSPLAEEWSARVEALQRLMETAPEWSWLWEIRLRVLRFLRSRYGEAEASTRLPAPPASFWIDPRPGVSRDGTEGRPGQWMSREQMREILDDIHAIASSPAGDDADVR